MTHFLRIDTPFTVWYEDLAWLLDRCDSVLPDRVCVCFTFEDAASLRDELAERQLESTILDNKPTPTPLPKYARMILAGWLKDQREEARCPRY